MARTTAIHAVTIIAPLSACIRTFSRSPRRYNYLCGVP
jgi:hypothetical protein